MGQPAGEPFIVDITHLPPATAARPTNCTAISVGPFTVRLFTIFGAALRSLYGSQPAVVQNLVSPIIFAWCVKISAR